jgi:hypothetical protein
MHLLIVLLAAMGKFAVSLGLSFVVHLAAPHALWTGLVLFVAVGKFAVSLGLSFGRTGRIT